MGSNPMGCKKIQALPCVCMVTHDKPCRLPPFVIFFFYRVSRLTHDKVSPCVHNLAVSKSRVHRERVCHVFFAVNNTGLAVCLHGDTRQTLLLGHLSPFVIFFAVCQDWLTTKFRRVFIIWPWVKVGFTVKEFAMCSLPWATHDKAFAVCNLGFAMYARHTTNPCYPVVRGQIEVGGLFSFQV
jgi:hypothetical protein